jgi:hypothetical protein
MWSRNARVAREVPRHAEVATSGPADYGVTSMTPCISEVGVPWNVQ